MDNRGVLYTTDNSIIGNILSFLMSYDCIPYFAACKYNSGLIVDKNIYAQKKRETNMTDMYKTYRDRFIAAGCRMSYIPERGDEIHDFIIRDGDRLDSYIYNIKSYYDIDPRILRIMRRKLSEYVRLGDRLTFILGGKWWYLDVNCVDPHHDSSSGIITSMYNWSDILHDKFPLAIFIRPKCCDNMVSVLKQLMTNKKNIEYLKLAYGFRSTRKFAAEIYKLVGISPQ